MLLAKRKDLDLTGGPLFSTMIRFAIPLLVANLISTMFHAVDLMVLSWFDAGTAVAAVGATSSVNGLFSQFSVGLCVGVNIILARLLGEGDRERVRKVVSTAILTGALLGSLIAIIGLAAAEPFLLLTDCPEECFSQAALYSRLYFLGMPFILIYYYAAAVIRVSGDSQSPLRYMVISGSANLVLNFIFCLLFTQKVAAVALATMLSQVLGAYLSLRRLSKSEGACRWNIRKIIFDFASFKKMLWYGLPTAITNMVYPLSNLQVQTAMNGFGADFLTGSVACMQYENIVANAGSSFSATALTFMGQNIGAGKKPRVYRAFYYMLFVQFLVTFGGSCIVLLFGKQFAALFGAGSGVALETALLRMRVVLMAYFIVQTPLGAAIQAFGFPQLQTAVNLAITLGLRTVWMQFVYGKLIAPTPLNLFLCYPISYSVIALIYIPIAVVLFYRYAKGKLNEKI